MNITDFRVGNHLMHPIFNEYTRIKAIAFNGFYIGTPEGNPIHISEFKPIKLSEDILINIGFEMINKSYFEFKVEGKDLVFEYTKDLNGDWYMMINEDIQTYMLYLHEFENLYYSLMKKQLEIELEVF
jgi:hypothetical protein